MSYAYEIEKLSHWIEFTKSSLIPPFSFPEITIGIVSMLELILNDPETTILELEQLVEMFSIFEVRTERQDYKRLNSVVAQIESRAVLIRKFEDENEETRPMSAHVEDEN